jgi:hypothetical protein
MWKNCIFFYHMIASSLLQKSRLCYNLSGPIMAFRGTHGHWPKGLTFGEESRGKGSIGDPCSHSPSRECCSSPLWVQKGRHTRIRGRRWGDRITDSDPNFLFVADPDPAPHQKSYCNHWPADPPKRSPWRHFEPSQLIYFDFDADPDLTFRLWFGSGSGFSLWCRYGSYLDPASQNDAALENMRPDCRYCRFIQCGKLWITYVTLAF